MDPATLEKLIGGPRDGPMLRLSLGRVYLQRGEMETAVRHLRQAVSMDDSYTAAWKELGRALAEMGHEEQAREAYRRGIEVASSRGDKQAEKEMTVFLRRLDKT